MKLNQPPTPALSSARSSLRRASAWAASDTASSTCSALGSRLCAGPSISSRCARNPPASCRTCSRPAAALPGRITRRSPARCSVTIRPGSSTRSRRRSAPARLPAGIRALHDGLQPLQPLEPPGHLLALFEALKKYMASGFSRLLICSMTSSRFVYSRTGSSGPNISSCIIGSSGEI